MGSEMSTVEMLDDLRNWYTSSVKPKIQEGNLIEARIEMSNLYVTLLSYAEHFRLYASATLFVASAHSLEEALINNAPLDTPTDLFEAYLAQLGLALQTGNTSNSR